MDKLKNKKTVSRLFIQHMMFLGIETIFLVGAFLILLNYLIYNEIIYPANFQENTLNKIEDKAEQGIQIDSYIDSEYLYAVFDKKGVYQRGTLSQEKSEILYEKVQNKEKKYSGKYIRAISTKEENYYILYDIKTGFYNPALRKVIPSPDIFLLMVFAVILLLNLWRIARKFGKTVSVELEKLKTVTENIEAENLNFIVPNSSLKEINEVFCSMGKLKDNLNSSLHTQWEMETSRREQIDALGHDLKTPLTIIRGNAELLYECSLDQEQNNLVNHIEKNICLMQEYIQRLLEINRSEKEFKICKVQMESKIMVGDFIEDSIHLARRKNIKFTYEIKELPDKIMVDSEILKRIVLNLVDNAVEYSPEEGTIFMKVSMNGENLHIQLEDSGKGFTKEDLKYATKQFYRNDESRSSRYHMGIGLYFADVMLKQLNGELRLSNSEKFGGAKVEIILSHK